MSNNLNNVVSYRVTDDMKDLLAAEGGQRDISASTVAREYMMKGMVAENGLEDARHFHSEELGQLTFALLNVRNQVSSVGNNVNQIAKNLNILAAEGDDEELRVTDEELLSALSQIGELKSLIAPVLEQAKALWGEQVKTEQMLGKAG